MQWSLLLPKALSLLNGEGEFLHELLVAFVGRQIQSVETRVRPRQPTVLADLLDTKSLRAVASCNKEIEQMKLDVDPHKSRITSCQLDYKYYFESSI